MRIGLLSDIHCNLRGLERALALLDDCDEVLCAGDIVYQYRFSNDVLATLRARGVRSIVGNHDKTVLYWPAHPLRTSASVDPEYLRYLGSLPNSLSLELDGMRIQMFHGSPWDDERGEATQYIYPQSTAEVERISRLPADVVVLGHTHVPFVHETSGPLIVNPGSCSETRDGSGLLSCAMLDTTNRSVDFRRFTLD